MSLILPKRALIEPPVIEVFGAPEFYVDGTVRVVERNMVHVICYIERTNEDQEVERREVLRCHFERSRYEQCLVRAVGVLAEGRKH